VRNVPTAIPRKPSTQGYHGNSRSLDQGFKQRAEAAKLIDVTHEVWPVRA
jgi:hypothetical protein